MDSFEAPRHALKKLRTLTPDNSSQSYPRMMHQVPSHGLEAAMECRVPFYKYDAEDVGDIQLPQGMTMERAVLILAWQQKQATAAVFATLNEAFGSDWTRVKETDFQVIIRNRDALASTQLADETVKDVYSKGSPQPSMKKPENRTPQATCRLAAYGPLDCVSTSN
eukprot:scaffold5540_cov181-Amphora_coffeaeformis.AAC.7